MSSFDWQSFLMRWSQETLQGMRYEPNKLPPQVIRSGWLGFPGATEEQIAQAENRLGRKLPPSYREFLKVTNGWYLTTPFVYRLWSVQEIEWFPVRHQSWLDDFTRRYEQQHQSVAALNGTGVYSARSPVSDQEYLVYGEEQNCKILRVQYMQTALEISDRVDSDIYLLNPQVTTPDGEWEAWLLGDSLPGSDQLFRDWRPGANRYRSFYEMMQDEYLSFVEMQET
jgi:hypothetical protein